MRQLSTKVPDPSKAPAFVVWLWVLLSMVVVSPARGLEPDRHISQYGHTAWRLQDGTFAGMPKAITQTADGYLWIATQTGLVRFDGARFVPFAASSEKFTPNQSIVSVLGTADGSLWIGTYGALFRWNAGQLAAIPLIGVVENVREDHDGIIWITRSRASSADSNPGPLCSVRDMVFKCYGKAEGIPFKDARPILIDGASNVWVASETQVSRWNPGSSQTFTLPGMKGTESLDGIEALENGPDGSMLVGVRFADGLGLQTLADGTWKPYALPGFDGSRVPVSAMLKDREDSLWIGTVDQGLYRIRDAEVDHYRTVDGLSSDTVNGLYEDREGDLWVATSNGVDRFRDMQVATVSKEEGLSANLVNAVLAGRDGTIWLGNGSALDSIRQGRMSHIAGKNLPGKEVTSLLSDHLGRLWVGVDDGLNVMVDGKFIPIKRGDGSPTGSVIAITEDSANNVWAQVIAPNELIRIKDDKVQEVLSEDKVPTAFSLAADPRGGIWLGLVNGKLARFLQGRLEVFSSDHPIIGRAGILALTLTTDGSVWGASPIGLVVWRHGVARTLTMDDGLPCNRINSLVSDRQDDLWLYTQCGLVEISHDDLRAWTSQPNRPFKTRVFGPFDGVHPGRGSFQPTGTVATDGKIWFVNENVAQVIDPAHLPFNELPPLVHVEQLIADRKSYPLSGGQPMLPALTRDLEIDYTALSYAIPEKVQVRYMLEGRDTNWQEPGTRRQAFYTSLAPGSYRFHVIAANNDGVWNETGDELRFSVAAAWYQRRSFLVFCLFIFVILLWGIYRFRVAQVAKAIGARFDERIAERTRLAQELHDTLLQTIQGSKMVADDALHESTDPERMRATMRRLSQWLGQAIQEGRAALASLRVSVTQQNDLAAALQRAAEECLLHHAMEVQFSVTGEAREMHPIARDEVYRIGYEAIRNACSHSGGTQLVVDLSYGQDLRLKVGDNGCGMDPVVAKHGKEGHFGLRGMRERAMRIGGQLVVETSPTSGTEIGLWVPGKTIFRVRRTKP